MNCGAVARDLHLLKASRVCSTLYYDPRLRCVLHYWFWHSLFKPC